MKPARMDWVPAFLAVLAGAYVGVLVVFAVGLVIRLVWGPL